MDLSVQAVVAGTIIGVVVAILAIAAISLVRRRRDHSTRDATSQRLADLHTTYDSLKGAMLAMDAGDYARALVIGEQVFEGSTALAPHTVSVAHLLVGEAASRVGAHRTATAHLSPAIDAIRQGSLVAPLSELLRMQARAETELCEFDEALRLAREATEAARVTRDKAASLALQAEITLARGDLDSAGAILTAAGEAGGGERERAVLDHLGGLLLAARNDLDAAGARLQTALARYERTTDPDAAARVMVDLAEVAERQGDVAKARSLMRRALNRSEGRSKDGVRRARVLTTAAAIEAAAGDATAAERYLEAATQLFTAADLPAREAYLGWARSRIASARGNRDAAGAALWSAEQAAARLEMGMWREKLRSERERVG